MWESMLFREMLHPAVEQGNSPKHFGLIEIAFYNEFHFILAFNLKFASFFPITAELNAAFKTRGGKYVEKRERETKIPSIKQYGCHQWNLIF